MHYDFTEDEILLEIQKEFDSYQEIKYDEPKDIAYAFDVLGRTQEGGRNFGFIAKSGGTIWNMRRESIIIEVIQRLIELENPDEILLDVKMFEGTMTKIIRLFIEECIKRNIDCPLQLDKIAPKGIGKTRILKGWKRPNVKLTENKVRNIRVMLQSYSMKSIARIYEASPATIAQIRDYSTWKNIKI